MDGSIDGLMDGWINKQTDGWMNRFIGHIDYWLVLSFLISLY